MCGIAGAFSKNGSGGLRSAVDKMLDAENHRGLDGRGTWCESFEGGGVALGHVRLSIIDLSTSSAQPMKSRDGRYQLVYNGELYNYLELREELKKEGVPFATSGDTEVVLNALIAWGPSAFARFNGMWALALFDRRRRTLLLSRDRFGEKPLYYLQDGPTLWFASEIKAILVATQKRPVNKRIASIFLSQFMLDADQETFFDGVFAVPPASSGEFSLDDAAPRKGFVAYWEVPTASGGRAAEPDLLDTLRDTFIDSVRIRLRSDVPLGVLLSGGVDSSCMAAAMRRILGSESEIHSISAVSRDKRFSEDAFVDIAATASGTISHKVDIDISPRDALELLPRVIRFNDQPVASFSAVAHFKLMEIARDLGIVVVLSGQGADELLCGYRKFLGFYLMDLARKGHLVKGAAVFLSFLMRGTVLSQFSLAEARRYLPGSWKHGRIDIRQEAIRGFAGYDLGTGGGTLEERQRLDLLRYSVPQLVHYEDRMSMAFCREIRLPFLDHRLVELLVPLRSEWKLRNGWTKWVLRKAMNDLVDPRVLWRKDKRGFTNPQERWLKQDLAERITGMLDGDLAICDYGLVDREALARKYRAYRNERIGGGRTDSREIFAPLAMELWLREYDWALTPAAMERPA